MTERDPRDLEPPAHDGEAHVEDTGHANDTDPGSIPEEILDARLEVAGQRSYRHVQAKDGVSYSDGLVAARYYGEARSIANRPSPTMPDAGVIVERTPAPAPDVEREIPRALPSAGEITVPPMLPRWEKPALEPNKGPARSRLLVLGVLLSSGALAIGGFVVNHARPSAAPVSSSMDDRGQADIAPSIRPPGRVGAEPERAPTVVASPPEPALTASSPPTAPRRPSPISPRDRNGTKASDPAPPATVVEPKPVLPKDDSTRTMQ